jgi:chromosome segregation ATPase
MAIVCLGCDDEVHMSDTDLQLAALKHCLSLVDTRLESLQQHLAQHDFDIQQARKTAADHDTRIKDVLTLDGLAQRETQQVKQEMRKQLADQQAVLDETRALAHELSARVHKVAQSAAEAQKAVAASRTEAAAATKTLSEAVGTMAKDIGQLRDIQARHAAELEQRLAALATALSRTRWAIAVLAILLVAAVLFLALNTSALPFLK